MHLVRDVLDARVTDITGAPLGRVDGISLSVRPDGPPLVSDLLLGGTVIAERLPGVLTPLLAPLARRLSVRGGVPHRIPWRKVRRVDLDVVVDEPATESAALATARWIRQHIVARIPGA